MGRPTSRCQHHHANTYSRRVNEESVLAVQIFDQKKFKKKDQGFLGVINVRIGSVIDLDAGGDGRLATPPLLSPGHGHILTPPQKCLPAI